MQRGRQRLEAVDEAGPRTREVTVGVDRDDPLRARERGHVEQRLCLGDGIEALAFALHPEAVPPPPEGILTAIAR